MFSGIETEHLVKSAVYFIVSFGMIALAITSSLTKPSGPWIFILFFGMIIFFYALPHPWRNAKNYFMVYAALFFVFAIMWIAGNSFFGKAQMPGHMGEDLAWAIGVAIIAAFIGNLMGIIAFSEGLRLQLYCAGMLLLADLFLMFPQAMDNNASVIGIEVAKYSVLVLQVASLSSLYIVLRSEKRCIRLKKLLLITAVILFAMGLWGMAVPDKWHWMEAERLWGLLLVIAGIIIFYGFATYEGQTE